MKSPRLPSLTLSATNIAMTNRLQFEFPIAETKSQCISKARMPCAILGREKRSQFTGDFPSQVGNTRVTAHFLHRHKETKGNLAAMILLSIARCSLGLIHFSAQEEHKLCNLDPLAVTVKLHVRPVQESLRVQLLGKMPNSD